MEPMCLTSPTKKKESLKAAPHKLCMALPIFSMLLVPLLLYFIHISIYIYIHILTNTHTILISFYPVHHLLLKRSFKQYVHLQDQVRPCRSHGHQRKASLTARWQPCLSPCQEACPKAHCQ